MANKFFNILTNVLHGSHFTDVCNCYKVFRSDVIKGVELRSDGFEVCYEITANLVGEYRFVDVPIQYRPRTRAEGKKVSWLDIFPSAWAILRFDWRKAFRRLVRRKKADLRQ